MANDTIVSTASALLGGATDLALGGDGRLYLADFTLQQVLSIRPDGTDPRVIGREGEGPGEFGGPWALAASDDTLWVFDRRRGDVQVFTLDGGYVRAFTPGVSSSGSGRTLNRMGKLAFATGGMDTVLVTIVDSEGNRARSVGRPVTPAIHVWDFSSIKERIQNGEVPDEFRNSVLPVWGSDGSLFVAFLAEPEARRYGPEGSLQWSRELAGPVLERTRAAFIRKNREEPNPAYLFTLQYVEDAQAVGGDLWLLLNTGEEDDGVILVLDGSDGSLRRRIILADLPNTGPFAVDRSSSRLYVVVPDEAMLVAFDLP